MYLACCAGAIRQFFKSRDYDPDQHPLISATPFAGERPDDMPGIGNFATMDYCWLPTHIEDPLERVQAAHQTATEMKAHMKECVEAGADISSILQICPPWLMRALRWYIERHQGKFSLFANVVLSNVPGPKEPIYLDRYKLDSWFSTGQVFEGTCLNMTMWSYCGKTCLCILADAKIVPDGWVIYNSFVEELKALLALVPEHKAAEESVA